MKRLLTLSWIPAKAGKGLLALVAMLALAALATPAAAQCMYVTGQLRCGTSDVRGTGTLALQTLNAAVSVALQNGEATTAFTVTNLTGASATLTAEKSIDGGTTWSTTTCNSTIVSTFTADGNIRCNTAGFTNIRLRVSTAGSTQTATVAYNMSSATGLAELSQPVTQGPPNAGGILGWFVRLLDGAGNAISSTGGAENVYISGSALSGQSVNLTQVGGSTISSSNPVPTSPSSACCDSGTAPVTSLTPNSSSHSAGQVVGGLFSVPVARINGGSGIITNLNYISSGGATTQLVVRIWDKNPVNSTITDNSAFVSSATDDQHLVTPPFTITPAAPLNTTGDSKTYASVSGVSWDYANQDGTPGKNVYVCLVTNTTDTADESHAIYVTLSGPQN